MLATKNILLRLPLMLANQVDAAARSVGLSRNKWITCVLQKEIDHVLAPSDSGFERACLDAVLYTRLMLETWLVHDLGPQLLEEIGRSAETISNDVIKRGA